MVLSSSTTDKTLDLISVSSIDLSSDGTGETVGPVPFSSVPSSPNERTLLGLPPFQHEVLYPERQF